MRYYAGTDGRAYCYDSEPTLRCPYAAEPPAWMEAPTGLDLRRVFRRAHQASTAALGYIAPGETEADRKRCGGCGTHLESLGYRAWIEEPWPSEKEIRDEVKREARAEKWDAERASMELSSRLSSRAIGQRLGATHRTRPGSPRLFPTKGGANGSIAWAREQARIDKNIGREEARA